MEAAIILEDDCLPNPDFFRFCQEPLEHFWDDTRIFAISGDNFQFGQRQKDYSYYFSLLFHCWGWASWRRVWRSVDLSMSTWSDLREGFWLERAVGDEPTAKGLRRTFDACCFQDADTWAFRALYASISQSRLNVLPTTNLVSNIGFSTDSHSGKSVNPHANLPAYGIDLPLRHPPCLIRDYVADLRTFYSNDDFRAPAP